MLEYSELTQFRIFGFFKFFQLDSLAGLIRALENSGQLHWKYFGTPYEKGINPDGVTTELCAVLTLQHQGL